MRADGEGRQGCVALHLHYKADVCGLASVLLASKGGMASKQRCAGRAFLAGSETGPTGWQENQKGFYWGKQAWEQGECMKVT